MDQRYNTFNLTAQKIPRGVCVFVSHNLLQYAEEKYVFDANLSFVRPNINPWVFYLTAYTNIYNSQLMKS